MSDSAERLIKARKAEKLSQAGMGKKLGVTPNTVARWERREIPVPQWVSRLQALEETHAKLKQANADLLQDLLIRNMEVSALKAKIRVLKIGTSSSRSVAGGAKELYRKLALKFHPDRNPAHAEVMRSINEIYQSLKK